MFATALDVSAALVPTEIPLKPYIEGTRLVELMIGGATGDFIFDTAGGLTLITPEFARAVGAETFGRLTGFRHTGELLQFQRTAGRPVMIGGTVLPQTELAQFDLTALLKGAPVVQGLVALNSFDGALLTVDYALGRLTLETETSLAVRTADSVSLQIRPARECGGAALDVFVAVDSPRGPLWLLLDSGNAGPVLLSPHAAAQLGMNPAEKHAQTTLRLTGGLDYQCAVTTKESIYDGLLNTAFFLQHAVTLDLRHMRAWVRKNQSPPNTRAP